MKWIRLIVIIIVLPSIIVTCDSLLDDENQEEGKYTFWSNFDGPPIDILIENNYYGSISTFYSSNPGCEADGCVTVTLAAGTYNFEAIEQANNSGTQREWDGTIEIKPNICGSLGLSP
jgi:hypothetical protein